jgi:hypothetical protein
MPDTNISAILERVEAAVDEMHAATLAAIRLARSIDANAISSQGDDDMWLRMPVSPRRCPLSGISRTTIEKNGREGSVRTKLVDGKRYYSGADVRKYIAKS